MSTSREQALASLVAEGTLTPEQARRVSERLAGSPSDDVADRDVRGHAPARTSSVLAQVLGYAGAALVASALLNLLTSQWPDWSESTRIIVAAVGLLALVAAVAFLTVRAGGRDRIRPPDENAAMRRAVATAAALATIPAGLLATTATIAAQPGSDDSGWSSVIGGLGALAAGVIAAWWVRGVMTTLAVAAGVAWLTISVVDALSRPEPDAWIPVLVTAVACVWLALAPRLLASPVLCEALGVAFMIAGLAPLAFVGFGSGDAIDAPAWIARAVLAALAVVGLTIFARGGNWPWAAGGTAAGTLVALAIAGDTLGWIAALLVSGAALLLLSAVLFAVRGRHMRSGAVTPHRSSPFAST